MIGENAVVVVAFLLLLFILVVTVYLKRIFEPYINGIRSAGQLVTSGLDSIWDCSINRSPEEIAEIARHRQPYVMDETEIDCSLNS